MKQGKSGTLLVGSVALASAVLLGCGGDGTAPPVDQKTLSISPVSASLRHPGDTIRLLLGGTASSGTATWSSSNTDIVDVSSDGLVTAVGYGSATVKATAAGLEASASISVPGETSLAFLLGTWSTEDVSAPDGLDPSGSLVVASDQGALRGVWRGTMDGVPVEVVTLALQAGQGWAMARADGVRGTFAVMDGSIAPGLVILDSGTSLGGTTRERTVLSDFTSSSFRWSVEESTDGGSTWVPMWTQRLTKDAPRAMPTPLEATSPACGDPVYGQFDFWVGDWVVKVPSGGTAGTNLIHRVAGCGVQENWRDAQSGGGVSLNMFDPRNGRWAQFYAASTGGIVVLYGSFQTGSMVLESPNTGVRDRVTWSLLDDGRVRQHWERSTSPGAFSTFFDGYYNPK